MKKKIGWGKNGKNIRDRANNLWLIHISVIIIQVKPHLHIMSCHNITLIPILMLIRALLAKFHTNQLNIMLNLVKLIQMYPYLQPQRHTKMIGAQ